MCIHGSFFLGALPHFSTIPHFHLTPISFYLISEDRSLVKLAHSQIPMQWELMAGNGITGWNKRMGLVSSHLGFLFFVPSFSTQNAVMPQTKDNTKPNREHSWFYIAFCLCRFSYFYQGKPRQLILPPSAHYKLSPSFHSTHRNVRKLIFLWDLYLFQI